MKREEVESSCIRSVGYGAKERMLEIEFLHGRIYRYFDVPKRVHGAMMKHDSRGGFFREHILGQYEYSRIR